MKTYTVQFSETEFQALVGLMDAGVKATGLRSVVEAAVLLQKLQNTKPVEVDDEPSV